MNTIRYFINTIKVESYQRELSFNPCMICLRTIRKRRRRSDEESDEGSYKVLHLEELFTSLTKSI